MEKQSAKVRIVGQYLPVLLVSILFGSTMILSAVGPARASEVPVFACQDHPAALRYLA